MSQAKIIFEERECFKEAYQNTNQCSSEAIYNEARRWTMAIYQNIAFYEWLPKFLGREICDDEQKTFRNDDCIPRYQGYQPNTNPQISQEFQTSAMRYGHTLVTPGVWLRSKSINVSASRIL